MSAGEHARNDAPSPPRPGALESIERLAGIQLANRFVWLTYALALYLVLQLSYIQWQSGRILGHERFDTLALASHVMVIVEAALLLAAMLLAGATPRVLLMWRERFPRAGASYIATGLAGSLCIALFAALLLIPVITLHAYPQLAAQGYSLPLMFLQRGLLLAIAVLISFNIMHIVRLYLGVPWWIAAVCGALWHAAAGYTVTYLSFTIDSLRRLNDLFYYNQLWQYIDGFPRLQRAEVYTNMQEPGSPYFIYFILAAAGIWILTLLLWLPRAAMLRDVNKL